MVWFKLRASTLSDRLKDLMLPKNVSLKKKYFKAPELRMCLLNDANGLFFNSMEKSNRLSFVAGIDC